MLKSFRGISFGIILNIKRETSYLIKKNSMKHSILKSVILIHIIFSGYLLNAQSGIVSGTLRDDAGDALPGVSILVKGTTRGTMTLADGTYSIECSVGDVLIFSYIGMDNQEVKVHSGMFKTIYEKPITEKKELRLTSVTPIRNNSYSMLLNNKTIQTEKFTNMSSTPYSWSYKKNSFNNYFQITNYKNIKEKDSLIEFEKSPEPLAFGIDFNTFFSVKSVMNLPALQKKYAQGRPSGGENMWFGPEQNEIFAWGPKIENLAFDGSDYAYDHNGRLVKKSVYFNNPANLYDPYKVFEKGFLFKNSLKVKFEKDNDRMNILFSDYRETGVLPNLKSRSNMIKLDFENKLNLSRLLGGFSYYRSKGNFVNADAMWTKTMGSILLTPPTFDNDQGYLFTDNTQRSSAVDNNNNPYFLLNENHADSKNLISQAYLHYNLYQDDWDIISEINVLKSKNQELVFIPGNTLGFEKTFERNSEINSTDLNIKLSVINNRLYFFNFSFGGIFNNQTLNKFENLTDNEDSEIRRNRQTLNLNEGFEILPLDNTGLIINVRNNSYLTENHQKWFLPRISFSVNISDLTYAYNFPYLNITGAYHKTIAEYPLYLQDKSYESVLFDVSNFYAFRESNHLFYNKDLKLESRESFDVGIDFIENQLFSFLRMRIESIYNYTKTENSIFPVIKNNGFELQNVASIAKHSLEANIFITTRVYYNFIWEANFLFSKYRSKVLEIYGNETIIPIAGFTSVSKNLIEGEPVGVLIGSVYERNTEGQMIIGTDGYPIVSSEKQIIGDPNPDYYMALENRFKYYGFSFSFLVDHQKGGDIWNGTGNVLDYHGLSEKSAEERTVSDHIYPGVDENGNVNTILVDFANPENGVENNYKVRYGYEGVAEDAIEDASWFRIKEINFSYELNRRKLKFFNNIIISAYMNNVFVFSKYSGSSPISRFNNYIQGYGLDLFNFPDFREFGLRLNVRL